jgi:thiamine biosynthesis lipoprotein ApbE
VQAARARALRPVVDGAFAELGRQIDTKNPDSELSAFHTPPDRQPLRATPPPPRGTVSQGTALLVHKALAIAAATGGAFDPTQPAATTTATTTTITTTGATANAATVTMTATATATATVTVGRPTFRRLAVEGGRLQLDGYDVVVALDDIAEAAAAAAVARVLAENGFANARVVVGNVNVDGGLARATAARTEGLLDPRTGAPAAAGPASCVVVADDAVVAAALARACLVLGEASVKAAAATLGATVTVSTVTVSTTTSPSPPSSPSSPSSSSSSPSSTMAR